MKDLVPQLVVFLAIASRATVLVMTAPLLSMTAVPQRVRLAIALVQAARLQRLRVLAAAAAGAKKAPPSQPH